MTLELATSSFHGQCLGFCQYIHIVSLCHALSLLQKSPLNKGSMTVESSLLPSTWSQDTFLSALTSVAVLTWPPCRLLSVCAWLMEVNNHSLLCLWYSVILRLKPCSLLCLTSFGWHIPSSPSGPWSTLTKGWDEEEVFSSPPQRWWGNSALHHWGYKAFILDFFTFSPWILSWLSAVPRITEAYFVHLSGILSTGWAASHLGMWDI